MSFFALMNICFDWWHPIVYYQCWPTSLQKCLVIVLFSRGHWVSVSVLLLMFGGWHLLAYKKHSSGKWVPVRESFIVSCSLKELLERIVPCPLLSWQIFSVDLTTFPQKKLPHFEWLVAIWSWKTEYIKNIEWWSYFFFSLSILSRCFCKFGLSSFSFSVLEHLYVRRSRELGLAMCCVLSNLPISMKMYFRVFLCITF